MSGRTRDTPNDPMERVLHSLAEHGYTPTFFRPLDFYPDDPHEEEAYAEPHPPQRYAALQCFDALYCRKAVWVHLAAEMQAGKTGVITAVLRLVLANTLCPPENLFVVTGLSDNAWREQTRARLPPFLRENCQHLHGLEAIGKRLVAMPDPRNLLFFLDESHIAARKQNGPNRYLFGLLQGLCPIEEWASRNIRFVTISATDPAKVMAMEGDCTVVRLRTTASYQSVATLKAASRLRYLEECGGGFGNLDSCGVGGPPRKEECLCRGKEHPIRALDEIERAIREDFRGEPLYHLLRPRIGTTEIVQTLLHERFPEADILLWDATTHPSADINTLLAEVPTKTTFVLLKNMLYAAKTLDDTHVGILYDRVGGKDVSVLQSLLGRACGYGKSDRTLVYTSLRTVTNYEQCWKVLCAQVGASRHIALPANILNKRMNGVKAAATESRGAAASDLSIEPVMATPIVDADVDAVIETPDGIRGIWMEFPSWEAAKKWAPAAKEFPRNAAGFCLRNGRVMRYARLQKMEMGPLTRGVAWKGMKVGGVRRILYAAYRDLTDPTSVVYAVRMLKRVA